MKTISTQMIVQKQVLLLLAMLTMLLLSPSLITDTTLANGNSMSYTYDDAGRLTGVEYPDGSVITYAYDAMGNLLEREVTSGEWSVWNYDKDSNNQIDFSELLGGVGAYLNGGISYSQMIELIMVYLAS